MAAKSNQYVMRASGYCVLSANGGYATRNVAASMLKDGGTLYRNGDHYSVTYGRMSLDGKTISSPYPFPGLPKYVDGVDVDVQGLSSLLKALPVDCDRALLHLSPMALDAEGDITPEEAVADNGPVWLSRDLLGKVLDLVSAYPSVNVCTAGATRATQWTAGNLSFVLMPMHPQK